MAYLMQWLFSGVWNVCEAAKELKGQLGRWGAAHISYTRVATIIHNLSTWELTVNLHHMLWTLPQQRYPHEEGQDDYVDSPDMLEFFPDVKRRSFYCHSDTVNSTQ